jgi:hypothetical protein
MSVSHSLSTPSHMRSGLAPGLVTGAGCLAVLAAMLLRNIGIHYDETLYIAWAVRLPLGDAAETGKPYIFYLFNFLVYQALPQWPDWLRAIGLHVFYAVVNVLAVARLAWQAADTRRDFVWQFVILLSSALFIFSSTQVMMESAVLPLLTLTLAGLVEMDRSERFLRPRLLVLVSATVGVLVKETALPALAILFVAFWPRLGRRLWVLPFSMVLGLALNRILLWSIDAVDHRYGGMASLFDVEGVRLRLSLIWDYLWVWAFYVGPFQVIAVCVHYIRSGGPRSTGDAVLLRLGGLSLLATVGVLLASDLTFARYTYPVVWLGLIAFAFLLVRASRRLAAIAMLLSLVLIANTWGPNGKQMSLWPRFVANEAHYTAFTVFQGVPTLGWLAFAGDRRVDMCILLPKERSEGRDPIQRYLDTVTVNPRWFDETQIAGYQQCVGPKAVIRRQYQDVPGRCSPDCPRSEFSISVCNAQEVRLAPTPWPVLTNRTCLP